jgi:hypothetical protein
MAFKDDTLDLRTRDGRIVHLKVAPQAGVAKLEGADASAIRDGAFIGTTAVAQPDGTLRAVEVHVFPDAMRGTGEGHRPWDLQPGSSMTNATVSGMSSGSKRGTSGQGTGSSMTNATVSGVKASGGERTLKLSYQGGEQTVVVPSGIPIVKLAPGDRSLLKPGAHVFAIATEQDGALVTQRLTVGEGAVVPPM